jgi:AsmA protein
MKRALRLIGALVVLLLLAVVALPFLISPNRFRPMLDAELSRALARDVKVGDLKLAILSGGVTAGDLSIADDPAYSRAPFVQARAATIGVDLWPLIFSRQLHVTQLTLDQPRINLLQSEKGDWNFSSLFSSRGGRSSPAQSRGAASSGASLGAGFNLSVKLVKIANGWISYAQLGSGAKPRVIENVNVELRDFSANSAFPFSLSSKLAGGEIHLNGFAGPVNAADAALTPVKVKVKLSGFDVAAVDETMAGLGGLLSLNGVAALNGSTLYLNGRLRAEKLKLVKNGSPTGEPVEFDFELNHDMRKHSGTLRRGGIHIGNATASLTGTYFPQGESTALNMNLSCPEMPAPQLAALLPALGVALPAGSSFQGGMASAKLSFSGPVEALVADGSLGLNNTRLAGFDLGSKMSDIEKLPRINTGPNTDIQTFAATVHWAPDGSTIQDIQLLAPAVGGLRGGGTVSPSQALDFKMRATLHGGVAALPFVIEGTASNPVFRPDVKGLVHDVLGKKKR